MMLKRIANRLQLLSRFLYTLILNGIIRELFLNTRNRIINKRLTQKLSEQTDRNFQSKVSGSSITDSIRHHEYSEFCQKASLDEDVFPFFRSHTIYREVLEHVPHYLAAKYSHDLRKLPDREQIKNGLMLIDCVGTPWKFHYKYFGQVSPTAIRYAYFANEIRKLFPGINPQHICEIGCGFGGQALALKTMFDYQQITFVDLPQALSLTKRSLSECQFDKQANYLNPSESSPNKFDFLISNYAFSELSREYQDLYIRNFIRNSNAGFMAWNPLSFEELDGYSLHELLKLIPNSKAQREIPSSYVGNHYIYWNSVTN